MISSKFVKDQKKVFSKLSKEPEKKKKLLEYVFYCLCVRYTAYMTTRCFPPPLASWIFLTKTNNRHVKKLQEVIKTVLGPSESQVPKGVDLAADLKELRNMLQNAEREK